jgi:hypothetical protein
MEDWRATYRVLVGGPGGKKNLRGPKSECQNDNKKMDVPEVEWGHELECSGSG